MGTEKPRTGYNCLQKTLSLKLQCRDLNYSSLIDWIDLSACGFPESVALSELPGSTFRGRHRDLVTDMAAILRKDITDVVCLLTEPEFRKFRVRTLLDKYESSGM